MNPVDGEVPFVLLGGANEVTAQLGPRRLRGHVLGLDDLEVRTYADRVATTLQKIEQATLTVDVVVGEVELGEPGAGQGQVVLCRVPRDQQVLHDPVDLGAHQGQIPRVDRGEGPVPKVHNALVARVVQPLAVDKGRGPFVVLGLDLHGTQLATVG